MQFKLKPNKFFFYFKESKDDQMKNETDYRDMVHHRHSNPSKNNEFIKLILMKLVGFVTLIFDSIILIIYLGILLCINY